MTGNGDRPGAHEREPVRARELAEALLWTVVTNAPIFLFAVDRDGILRISEGRGLEAIGRSSGENVGESVWSLHAERPALLADFRKALAGESFRDLVELSGVSYEIWFSPVRDGEGGVAGAIGVATDVSAWVRAQSEIAASEERFRTLYENASVGLYRTTPDGRLLLVNPAMVRMLGYGSFGELQRRVEREGFYHPTYPRTLFKDRVEREGSVQGLEAAWRRRDGSLIQVRESAWAVRDGDGRVLWYEGTVEDVTERHRAEEERARALSLLEATLESTADGILVLDTRGGIVRFNQRFLRMWEVPEDVAGSGDAGRLIAHVMARVKDPEGFRRRALEILTGSEEETFDTIELADGRVFERYTQPQRVGGTVVGRVKSFRDVTERRRAEDQIAAERHRYRILSEAAFEGIVVHDKGVIREVNEAAARLSGYRREELVGKSVLEFIHPESRPLILENLREPFDTPFEARGFRKDGTEAIVEIAGRFIDPDGTGRLRVAAIRDITARKKAEHALEEANRRLEGIIRNSPAAIYTLDRDGRVLTWNPAAERIFGWTADEALGRFLPTLPEGRDEEYRVYAGRVLSGETLTNLELVRRRKDGALMAVGLSCSPVRDREGHILGMLSIVTDITDRRLLEAQMHAQRQALFQQERLSSLGVLVAQIAHEINNPLQYVKGNIELALMDLKEVEASAAPGPAAVDLPGTRRGLTSALEGVERLRRLVQALRGTVRQGPSEREDVDLRDILRGSEELIAVSVPSGVTVRFAGCSERCLVHASPPELHQVCLNLVRNAIEAVEPQGGTVTATCRCAGLEVELTVADDGPGIPPFILSELYEPFKTTKPSGTGLGLSIVHDIVKKHGGEVEVESRPGEGTKVRVRLPRVQRE